MELDRIPLWRGNHVSVRQLVDDFARYSYLPRLKDPSVLLEAIRDGLSLMTWEQDAFAYADSYDDDAGRYVALQSGPRGPLAYTDPGLLVRPEVARKQMNAEAERAVGGDGEVGPTPDHSLTDTRETPDTPMPGPLCPLQHSYLNVTTAQ